MGIFGAMTTAVSGLRAQSYALENISGNIANSQTTGFKRLDTSFVDLIPELPYRHELAGSVTAFSRLTNTIQGDLQSTGIPTNMALNGEGYFIVQERSGTANNRPIFGGGDLYTRRGDFALDKDGFLVNGAGYYLKGSSIDPVTARCGAPATASFRSRRTLLPARSTTEILYRANLPSSPATSSVTASAAGGGSATLTAPPATLPAGYDPRLFAPSATPPAVRMDDQGRFMSQSISGGAITVYNQVGAPIDVQLRWAKVESAGPSKATGTVDVSGAYTLGAGNDGNLTLNGTNIALVAADDDTAILSKINAQSAVTGVTASLDTANHLVPDAGERTSGVRAGDIERVIDLVAQRQLRLEHLGRRLHGAECALRGRYRPALRPARQLELARQHRERVRRRAADPRLRSRRPSRRAPACSTRRGRSRAASARSRTASKACEATPRTGSARR